MSRLFLGELGGVAFAVMNINESKQKQFVHKNVHVALLSDLRHRVTVHIELWLCECVVVNSVLCNDREGCEY